MVATATGRALRSIRLIAGWTQADLARESGLSASLISGLERGTLRLTAHSFEALGRALREHSDEFNRAFEGVSRLLAASAPAVLTDAEPNQ